MKAGVGGDDVLAGPGKRGRDNDMEVDVIEFPLKKQFGGHTTETLRAAIGETQSRQAQ